MTKRERLNIGKYVDRGEKAEKRVSILVNMITEWKRQNISDYY